MEPLEGQRIGSKVGIHRRTQICTSSQWVTFKIELLGSTFIEGKEGEEIAKARPEIQRVTEPGTLKKKKKKRVSRRKDKSAGSYFAERIRKLRTQKKKKGLIPLKRGSSAQFLKTLWKWKPDFMKKKKGMVSQERAETWTVS